MNDQVEQPPPGDPVFIPEMPDDIAVLIGDATFGNKDPRVVISSTHTINACNHVHSGTVDIDGVVHGFVLESGDRNGTVVLEWGDPEKIGVYDPGPPPEPATFLPKEPGLIHTHPGLWQVYLIWRKTDWFLVKERGLNYDRHFCPGIGTEQHYREWADKKGMLIGYLSSLSEEERLSIKADAKS